MKLKEKRIRDLGPGDRVMHSDGSLAYTVEGFESDGINAEAEVTFADGGMGFRFWNGRDRLDREVLVNEAT